jgi:glucuronoarabinoxylan endo-1,4-beta-xylanase
MKTRNGTGAITALAVVWCLVCGMPPAVRAQLVTNVIDTFDTNSYPNNSITNKWSNWFGGAFVSLALDPAADANTNPASGSLKISANFPVTPTDQFEVWNGINGFSPTINGFQFTNFQCDVRFAAGSATNSSGNFGSLQFGVPTPSYGQDYFSTSVNVPASNTNWVHVSINLNPNTDTNLQNMIGLLIHIWGAGIKGPSTLWVDNIQFVGNASTGTAVINYTNTAQRIDGFGASSAWMGSSLANSTADLLFSTNTGAGLSLLRTRVAPGGIIDDAEGTIAQQAVARGARVWSTPWSPPVIYKTTNSVNGGNFSNTVANYQGYAAQLANYVKTMTNSYGVQLYGISLQNEPDIATSYESCLWNAQQFHDFLPYVSAALTASNVASTKIIMPESMFWRFDLATNTMSDATTSNLVGILAGHNYNSSLAPPVTQFGTPCPKALWETEHYIDTDDSITNGLALAQEIHLFMTSAQASAYHYWWLTGSGTGSIADDPANPAKRLFVMGQWSKFVRPNFYRMIGTNTSTALISTFKEPSSSNFVIVAANNSAFPVNQTFTLTNFPVTGPLRQWVTSATESLANHGGAVSVSNGSFAMTLAPWTVTTFVYQAPVTNAPTILQSPANVIALSGSAVLFAVQASGGTAPLYYQWFFNGTNSLSGATNATLVLTNANLANAGNYSVVVTNFAGSVTSSVASLALNTIVWSAPVTASNAADILTNGTSLYAYNNSASSASVNAVTFAGVNSSSAWGSGVTFAGMTATATSAYGGGASTPWNSLPAGYKTILQGGIYNSGGVGTVTLNNLTNGHQYAVQVWVNDSRSGSTTNRTEILAGASNSTVTLAYNSTFAGGGVGQFTTGVFTATATNQSFTMDGDASTQLNAIQVRDITIYPPAITQQPVSQTNYVKGTANFAVTVAGSAPLNCRWFFNTNSALAAATNFSLTLTNLSLTNAGSYSVVITNNLGSVTSAVATLTVLSLPHPAITSFRLSGTNIICYGTNGLITGGQFYTLASTNLALPWTNWLSIATNYFGTGGSFIFTNAINAKTAQTFLILQLP